MKQLTDVIPIVNIENRDHYSGVLKDSHLKIYHKMYVNSDQKSLLGFNTRVFTTEMKFSNDDEALDFYEDIDEQYSAIDLRLFK